MNILFIVNNLSVGGAGRVVARLATQMSSMGHTVSVMITSNENINYSIPQNVQVYNLCKIGEQESKLPLRRMLSRVKKIRILCRSKGIDTVYSFLPEINIYSIIAGLGQKWTTIISERNDPNIDPPYKRVRLLRTALYSFCDGAVFQTRDAMNFFSKKVQKKGIIIYNPISDDIPEPYIGTREKRFVAAGRLNKQKNYPMMIKAFNTFCQVNCEYTLEIYGEGEEKENLEALISELELQDRVILKGQSYNLLSEIRTSACYLLSSDYEGMSNSLLEAMALQLPIITTDHPIGGARALIHNNENGYLVPVGDYNAMSERMIYVVNHMDKAEKCGKNNLNIIHDLSVKEIALQWLSFADYCRRNAQ